MVLVFFGCSSSNDEGEGGSEDGGGEAKGEVRVALYGQPPTLDMQLDTSVQTRDLGRLMFETLVAPDENFEATPMLAESVDVSDDGKTYTFNLREGVTFHNGEEMVAEDVVASMERWVEKSGLTGNIFDDAKWIDEDEYTVILELQKPSSLTLDTMASPKQAAAIMPKEVIDSSSAEGVEEYIGTGPFVFVEWKQDQYIHFAKYDDYEGVDEEPSGLAGKKEVMIDDLFFDIVTDSSTRLAGLKTGEYDIAYQIANDDYDQIESDPDLEPHPASHGELIFVYNKEEGIASDFDIRKAANTALDMDEIMLGAVISEDLYWLDPGYMTRDLQNWKSEAGGEFYNIGDVEEANKLLEAANYNDEPFRILTTRDDDVIYNASVVIQEQMTQAGFNVDLDVYDWPTMMDKRNEAGEWDALITGSSTVSTPPQLLALSSSWSGGVQSDHITELLNDIETAETQEEAKEIWDETQQYAWEEHLPVSVLGGYSMFHAATTKIDGFSTFSGAIFWNMSASE